MQIDGEPVLMEPTDITIEFKNQALMIEAKEADDSTNVI